MSFEDALKMRNRIACLNWEYGMSEAKYSSIKHWEEENNDNWIRYRDAMLSSFLNGEDVW